MSAMRFIKAAALLLCLGGLTLTSCKNKAEEEDKNATIVNVEKGAVSPVWNSESDTPQFMPAEFTEEGEMLQDSIPPAPKPAPAEEVNLDEETED